jgi:hypothetical protein
MTRLALLLLAPALAACASTGDYPGMTPAPVAYTAPAPLTETITPFDGMPDWTIQRTPGVRAGGGMSSSVLTMPDATGQMTPYHVMQNPMGTVVTPGVLRPLQPYRPLYVGQ